MHPTRRLGLVAMAVLFAACSTDDGAAAPTTPSSTVAATFAPSPSSTQSTPDPAIAGSGEDARLLLYANALVLQVITREEMVAFLSENVSESEIESCMNAAGFEYVPEQTAEENVAEDIRYSVSPEEYAATYGLGITGWDLGVIPPLRPPRNQATEWAMTDSERNAYNAARGQCGGMFDPERRARSNAVNIAAEQFRPVVDADPAAVAALAEWQGCMSSAGYDFDTPMQMQESFYARMNGGSGESLESIFDDEVRVAVANVPCESAYTSVRREVITTRFAEFKAFFDSALASGAAPEAQG